jgi:hypothetical protein
MNDLSDFQRRRGEPGKIDLSALDFDQIRRMMRWGLVVLGLILVWTGLRWLGTFYTDWLWFRELGHESVLVKIVTTRVILFTIAVAVFLGFALPSLYAAARSADRSPRPDAPLKELDYLLVHKLLSGPQPRSSCWPPSSWACTRGRSGRPSCSP